MAKKAKAPAFTTRLEFYGAKTGEMTTYATRATQPGYLLKLYQNGDDMDYDRAETIALRDFLTKLIQEK